MAQQLPVFNNGSMQELIHQPASLGEDWLQRLQGPTNERDLFKETSAMEDFIASVMKAQQVAPAPLQRSRAPATLPPVAHPPQTTPASFQAPQQPPSSAADAPKMDDIWNMIGKNAAAKPPVAPVPNAGRHGQPPVSQRSTQLENLYNILQRFNSTVQGNGVVDISSQPVGQPGHEPSALGAAFARTSSIEASNPWAGADKEVPLELELQPESIEPLPEPGTDEESRNKYREQCKANRAERIRKRKAVSEEGEEEDSNDPSVVKKVARMMRNRESAQRSRMKRQAYTDQLEAEVAKLKQEKAALATKVDTMAVPTAPPGLTAEQKELLEELRKQVMEFQKRESKLDLPPLKPLKRFHTMDM